MEPLLRDYIENLFVSAPKTRQAYELKEEIIRNTIERYHDLLSEGQTEGDAYNQAIAGIGDINELINELGGEVYDEMPPESSEKFEAIRNRSRIFHCIAVALYILCVVPCILLSNTVLSNFSSALMLFMISTATGLIIYSKMTKTVPVMNDSEEIKKVKTKAIIRAVAVGLYISCATPCIILSDSAFEEISPVFMFMIIAAATVLIILSRGSNTYSKRDDTMVENFKEWNGKKKQTSSLYKILVAVLWVTASMIYLTISFAIPVGFLVSWLVFLIASALQCLMKAIFDYLEASK